MTGVQTCALPIYLSRDEMGQFLEYGEQYIYCENAAYLLCKLDGEDEVELDRVDISQDDSGTDTEDRIIKLKRYLKRKKLQG